jgi:hypothetical protein
MKKGFFTKVLSISILTAGLLVPGAGVEAKSIGTSGLLGIFDSSWVQFQNNGSAEDGTLGRGPGGQKFDAEYLLYRLDGNRLSLGLQTGFNLITGRTKFRDNLYFAGDLALSFDGKASSKRPSSYEYAVDFGLRTLDIDGDRVGAKRNNAKDPAGVYKVRKKNGWNNDTYDGASPFAMDRGWILDDALLSNDTGKGKSSNVWSFYRIVTLDLDKILGEGWAFDGFLLDAHWTMSRGNDQIKGSVDVAPVPEPATMLLFGTGLLGLGGLLRRQAGKR